MRINILFTCLIFLPIVFSKKELKFVLALSRHGDRAPLHLPYPNDPYKESAWQRGWGQLTSVGMQQLNELGKFMRARYSQFISPNFVDTEMYMRSSDANRALVSAQSFFSGFYPANGSFEWQVGDSWQPIPVHGNTPGEDDLLCHPTELDCPRAQALVDAGNANDSAVYNKMYADMFNLLQNVTGIPDFGYMNVASIYDINREFIHNMTALQPAWVLQKWPQYGNRTTLEICSELRRIKFLNEYGTQQKAQFYGGYLLNTWINTALKVANGTQTNPSKMMWYSSHDSVVLALLYTMGIGNGQLPPYACVVLMEVYAIDLQYVVEVSYKNETNSAPYPLTLPGCGEPCFVSKMLYIYQNQLLSSKKSVEQNCGLITETTTPRNSSPSFLLFTFGIVFILQCIQRK